jgi:signal transduction histidine kinase
VGRNSLSARIIGLSGAWVIMALGVTALLLVYFYRDHAPKHYDEHVTMHLEELVEASEFLPDGTFNLAFNPSDPRYHVLNSGWYWEVTQSGKVLKRSPSLGENDLNLVDVQPSETVLIREVIGPVQEELRVHVMEIRIDPEREPLVFLASSPMTGITDDVLNFSNHVIGSFVLLGIGLLLAVVIQVRLAVKPLHAIGAGISEIREGKMTRLPDHQLEDVQPLVEELNNLLDHNAVLLKRARNQLGDLAHSVKNPLTVINNEARNMEAGQKELIIKQTRDISRNVDHYLSRARAFGTEKVLGARSEVKTVAEDLVYAMQRIHQERDLEYDISGLKGCWFKGEHQDLEELVGNLMDNACKWAKTKVSMHCKSENDRLIIVVEDDGPGISEEDFRDVMRRGHKLDESKPGHGQGLGIVKDIASLYGGHLKLGRSPLGGLRAELDLPAA